MTRKLWLAPLAALGMAALPVAASASSPSDTPAHALKEERIAFADQGGIRDWRFGPDDALYVQDRARRWYKAELMYTPPGSSFAWRIGFDTGPTGTFDRYSAVIVDRQRVPLRSLVRVDGPPPTAAKA